MRKLILKSKKCLNCHIFFGRETCLRVSDFKEKKFCKRDCYHAYYKGKKHHWYKNGTKTRPDGYIRDSETDEYIHRMVMERSMGRSLERGEIVHHKDGNPSNNRISNLIILTGREHLKHHAKFRARTKEGRFSLGDFRTRRKLFS